MAVCGIYLYFPFAHMLFISLQLVFAVDAQVLNHMDYIVTFQAGLPCEFCCRCAIASVHRTSIFQSKHAGLFYRCYVAMRGNHYELHLQPNSFWWIIKQTLNYKKSDWFLFGRHHYRVYPLWRVSIYFDSKKTFPINRFSN